MIGLMSKAEITLQEVKNLHSSNTNINKPDYSNTDFSKEKTGLGTFQNVFLSRKSRLIFRLKGYVFPLLYFIAKLSHFL